MPYCFILFFLFSCLTSNAFSHHPFVVITPEKTGTHLLTKTLGRIVGKEVKNCWEHYMTKEEVIAELVAAENENKFLHIHAFPTKPIVTTIRDLGYKVVFLIRDPRDTLISLYHYVETGWVIGPFNINRPYGELNFEDKIDELITGARFGRSMIQALFVERLNWMKQKSDFVFTARFENLVGEKGGGSDKAQLKEVIRLSRHIECKLSIVGYYKVVENLWGPQEGQRTTFRQGKIGAWKTDFSEQHKQVFQEKWGWLLNSLDYPPCFEDSK